MLPKGEWQLGLGKELVQRQQFRAKAPGQRHQRNKTQVSRSHWLLDTLRLL